MPDLSSPGASVFNGLVGFVGLSGALRSLIVWLHLFFQIKQGGRCKDNQHENRELLFLAD